MMGPNSASTVCVWIETRLMFRLPRLYKGRAFVIGTDECDTREIMFP